MLKDVQSTPQVSEASVHILLKKLYPDEYDAAYESDLDILVCGTYVTRDVAQRPIVCP
jgi:hypothetical protein